jgi:cell division transport system permease protein
MKNKLSISSVTFINSKITATISITLVLFLLGLIVLLSLLAGNLSTYVKESFSYDIILSDNIKTTQVNRLIEQLKATPYVKSTEFISKENAAKELEAEIGQDPAEFLGFNPLPATIVVHLNAEFANSEGFSLIESQIKAFSKDIQEIEYRKDLVDVVNDNLAKVGIVLLGLAGLLLIISFALISNTIRLMIYSKRFLIHTMKLVGATSAFILKPFIVDNIISGIIAAIIANSLLIWLFSIVANDITGIRELINHEALLIVFGSVLVLGIGISIAATYRTVNKYLKMNSNDLFYI